MSRILPLSQITGTNNFFSIHNAGPINLDPGIGSNYAITDLSMSLMNLNAVAAGAIDLTFQIGGLQGGGTFFPILTFAYINVATGAGSITVGESVVRTFPSALILPAGCQLYMEVQSFVNLTVANTTIDVSGFMF